MISFIIGHTVKSQFSILYEMLFCGKCSFVEPILAHWLCFVEKQHISAWMNANWQRWRRREILLEGKMQKMPKIYFYNFRKFSFARENNNKMRSWINTNKRKFTKNRIVRNSWINIKYLLDKNKCENSQLRNKVSAQKK